MPRFYALPGGYKQLATHVFVGMGAASFWRGAWYILDDHLFPEDAAKSAMSSLGLGVVGMAASQGLVARAERLAKRASTVTTSSFSLLGRPTTRASSVTIARFGALYTVAVSCVLVWRGTWLGWDVLYERLHPSIMSSNYFLNNSNDETNINIHNPQSTIAVVATDRIHATRSGLLSHVFALTALIGTGLFASVLAPPAAISVVRDATVKSRIGGLVANSTSSRSSSSLFSPSTHYQGPAQHTVNQLLSSMSQRMSSVPTTTTTTTTLQSNYYQTRATTLAGLSIRGPANKGTQTTFRSKSADASSR